MIGWYLADTEWTPPSGADSSEPSSQELISTNQDANLWIYCELSSHPEDEKAYISNVEHPPPPWAVASSSIARITSVSILFISSKKYNCKADIVLIFPSSHFLSLLLSLSTCSVGSQCTQRWGCYHDIGNESILRSISLPRGECPLTTRGTVCHGNGNTSGCWTESTTPWVELA